MDRHLTPKQKQVLEYITKFSDRHEYAPSQMEIAAHFGFKSLGTVQHYLVQLGHQGYLEKTWNGRRATRVTHNTDGGMGGAKKYASKSLRAKEARIVSAVELPLLGKVAAGLPIEVVERQETVEVPSSMLATRGAVRDFGNHFVLQVKGDSMIEEGIMEGDYVIFKKQNTAQNGQTVVALINNEATIKKYFRKELRGPRPPDGARRAGPARFQIELHPANSSYRPIVVDPTQSFKIEGILAGVIRKIC